MLILAIGPRNRKLAVLPFAKYMTTGMFMVEVYGKKARQINAQDPAHRRATRSVRKGRKEVEEKRKEEKKLPVPGRGLEPTLEGKAPVCIATTTLHKDPWLQLLYKYHEGYILNFYSTISNAHEGERERKCHRAELKVEKL